MKNAAKAAAKKRSISEGAAAEPPTKRPCRDAAATSPLWSDLTPELIGQIARFLPMRTPEMMRLLLCVGPRVAAVVRKMYLTGNENYLQFGFGGVEKGRVKERIGYWMDHNEEAWKKRRLVKTHYWMKYNEKAWKKRCFGKANKSNVHTVMLTPEQFRLFEINTLFGLNHVKIRYDEAVFDEASQNVLTNLTKNSRYFLLISVGDEDVDDGHSEVLDPLIDSAPVNSDGRICVRLMRHIDAFFAYPQFYLNYDLVDALSFQIEEKIIEPKMTLASVDCDGDPQSKSLLYLALMGDSADCFRYLLSLPGTDINAIALFREDPYEDLRYYESIIHSCVEAEKRCPSYLEDIISHSDVDLNVQNIFGQTALCLGCRIKDLSDNTISKLRLLLEAGADPRIEDDDEESPLSNIDDQISDMEASEEDPNEKLKAKLILLRKDISNRIQELNNMGGQVT